MMRKAVIGAGLRVLRATRLHALARPFTQGIGAILMFHNVRPWRTATPGYAPNRLLEITPEFFEAVIGKVRALGFEIVTMEAALERLAVARDGNDVGRFVVLTFDDGYRDTRDHALPVMRRLRTPFTVYVTTGFADASARLWWLELEAGLSRARQVTFGDVPRTVMLADMSWGDREKLFEQVYWWLRAMPEPRALDWIAALARDTAVDAPGFARDLCMRWDELAELASEPLCTIGAHTLTHPRLATHPEAFARAELARSMELVAEKLGRVPRHLAYPVGDPTSAGPREFAMARELGFASAVTTRPGLLFPAHAMHATALPRVSVNGNWQDIAYLEVLLSGAPFALWNRGQRVNVA